MKNNEIYFSIVLPTYNRVTDLQFALHCILHQSFSDFEIIISDNSSTDSTFAIIRSLKDKRVRYFRNIKNIDVISNIKKAMRFARGEYIFFHSDDDFLLYKNSLDKIYRKIRHNRPGYVRVNYLCLTSDKKRVFDFRINKNFNKDEYLPAASDNNKILSFILRSDASFITGLVVRNSLPRDIAVIYSEPFWAMKMLFYSAAKSGAYFMEEPQIIASMSQWRVGQKGYHPLYTLRGGKLASEKYLNLIREKLNEKSYALFLRTQLLDLYVYRFPAVKLCVGNRNMFRLAYRISVLDRNMTKVFMFWFYLIFAFMLPSISAQTLKNIYYFFYTRFSGNVHSAQILRSIALLQQEVRHRF